MNLYEIMFDHYSQKDSERGTLTYLIAKSDEDVYEWIKAEHELKNGRQIYCSYEDREEDDEVYYTYDDDNLEIEETFKERMIRLQGEMNDDDAELDDLYYGKTLYGWELIRENISLNGIEILKTIMINVEEVL